MSTIAIEALTEVLNCNDVEAIHAVARLTLRILEQERPCEWPRKMVYITAEERERLSKWSCGPRELDRGRSRRVKKLLAFLQEHPMASNKELRAAVGINCPNTIISYLDELAAQGLIVRGRGANYVITKDCERNDHDGRVRDSDHPGANEL